MMLEFYHLACTRGVRWDDSAFKIKWHLRVTVISDKDRRYEDFEQ